MRVGDLINFLRSFPNFIEPKKPANSFFKKKPARFYLSLLQVQVCAPQDIHCPSLVQKLVQTFELKTGVDILRRTFFTPSTLSTCDSNNKCSTIIRIDLHGLNSLHKPPTYITFPFDIIHFRNKDRFFQKEWIPFKAQKTARHFYNEHAKCVAMGIWDMEKQG